MRVHDPRLLAGVEPNELDTAVCGWLADRAANANANASGRAALRARRRHVSVDNETACGARLGLGHARHLLVVVEADAGTGAGQCEVDGKINEISAFGPQLDRLDSRAGR